LETRDLGADPVAEFQGRLGDHHVCARVDRPRPRLDEKVFLFHTDCAQGLTCHAGYLPLWQGFS
jgi:hypothetical protein